jgi:hypothetical protein
MVGADTSPTSLIVHLWNLVDLHCTEQRRLRAERKELMRDWPGLMTSSNCRCPADATSAGFLWHSWAMNGRSIGARGKTTMWAFATGLQGFIFI